MFNLKEKDKQQHLLAGMVITGLLYPVIGYYSIVVAILIGLIKEYVVDTLSSVGEPDFWDAVATAFGALLAGGIILIV